MGSPGLAGVVIIGVMAPSSGPKWYSRSYDADAALPLRVAQTLDPSSTLVKGSQPGPEIGRITTVCGQTRDRHTAVSVNVEIQQRFDIEEAQAYVGYVETSSPCEIIDRADIKTFSVKMPVRRVKEAPDVPAGISARRPEISLRASAQRDVESAIMLTLYPMSLKYSDNVIPAKTKFNESIIIITTAFYLLIYVFFGAFRAL